MSTPAPTSLYPTDSLAAVTSQPSASEPTPPDPPRPPALHVEHGRLVLTDDVLDGLPDEWREAFSNAATRQGIEDNLSSVGRIQKDSLILGTGFLVARNVVLTARHVAEGLTTNVDGVAKIRALWTPLVDFDGDTAAAPHPHPPTAPPHAAAARAEHEGEDPHDHNHAICGCGVIQSVIYMYDTLDLALLRISFTAPEHWKRPQPMKLTTKVPVPDLDPDAPPQIYLIGFPRNDATATPRDRRLFGQKLGVKRVQPGHITDAPTAGREFQHDASTLKGNSGSCVVDMRTHRVVGLHIEGSREEAGELASNRAIAFWLLSEEDKTPLRRAGVDLI